MLRRIYGHKKCEMVRSWRKLFDEELRNSCSLPNKIKMIKLRNVKWAGYVARVGRIGMLT